MMDTAELTQATLDTRLKSYQEHVVDALKECGLGYIAIYVDAAFSRIVIEPPIAVTGTPEEIADDPIGKQVQACLDAKKIDAEVVFAYRDGKYDGIRVCRGRKFTSNQGEGQ